MAHEIFITGATGFLGHRLLAELLRQTDCQFILLVRSPCARAILAQHLRPADLDRVRFVQGDVTLPGLGLDEDTRAGLAGSVHEVWHLAASTFFDESKRAETFRTNVEGTRHLLEVVAPFRRLETVYHMSTAYVCGKKLGCIPEGPFSVAEGFKNPYEESKHEAEAVVRASGLPVAILRPSIVLGDSRTGEHGDATRMMYGYALGLLRATMHAFESVADFWNHWRDGHGGPDACRNVNVRLLADPKVVKNMLPVDDCLAVCLGARSSGSAIGKTFNIVSRTNLSNSQINEAIQRVVRVTGYRLDPTFRCDGTKGESIVERVACRNSRLFWPYTLNTEPHWETGNVDALAVPRVTMTPELFESLMTSFVRTLAPSV